MKKIIFIIPFLMLTACAKTEPVVFCYQLAPQDIQPGTNCIPNGGSGSGS